MTLVEPLGRALIVAVIAALSARPIAQTMRRSRSGLIWALLLAPLLAPAIFVGHAWINAAPGLARYPTLHAALYALLVLMKTCPVAVMVLYFAPAPAMSDAAVHCARLSQGRMSAWPMWLRGRGRVGLAAFAVVFLLTFQEFELASLMEVRIGTRQAVATWTIGLFDAQTGGLPVAQTLQRAIGPVLCEMLVIAAILVLLFSQRTLQSGAADDRAVSRAGHRAVWVYLAVAVTMTCLLPGAWLARWALNGWRVVLDNPQLLKELRISTFFGATVAILTSVLARVLVKRPLPVLIGACVPGLFGALVLALLALSIFQTAALRGAYDTPLPLILTLVLLLLPLAMVLAVVLRPWRLSTGDHAITLLHDSHAKRQLIWETRRQRQWWMAFVLFYFAYFEVTASTLLAPSGMTPVTARLYNFMHYSQVEGLAAHVGAAMAVPVIICLVAIALTRWSFQVRG